MGRAHVGVAIYSTVPHTLAPARRFPALTAPFVVLARKAAVVVHDGFLMRVAGWKYRGRSGH